MSKSIFAILASASFVVGVFASPVASAQHSDIEVAVVSGKIVADPMNEQVIAFNGYKLFEGNFGDFYKGPNVTANPGFAEAHGIISGFSEGNVLYIRALETLGFWNGATWTTPASTSTTLSIADAVDPALFQSVNGTGTTIPAGVGVIGDVDASGGLHHHVDFRINPAAPTGAYRLTAQLWATDTYLGSPIYSDSDPFYIVFNRGLSNDAFEASLTALAVPEASTYALMLAGLGVVLSGAARRR